MAILEVERALNKLLGQENNMTKDELIELVDKLNN